MMGRRHRNPRTSLKRKVAVRSPRKTLIVFCEGRRTEPDYIEALKREPSVRDVAAVDIRIVKSRGQTTPYELVTTAIAAKRRAEDEEGEVDEFWCVFDVEWPSNHPYLREARHEAERHDIKLAVSNPCFELWLVLHFKDHGAWLDNEEARRLRRSFDGASDKALVGAFYMPRRQAAARRAAKLEEQHARNGRRFPHDNPSSGMQHLLASVSPGS